MRYINKGLPPAVITNFIAIQQPIGVNLNYAAFIFAGHGPALNQILRVEQRQICCYCLQRIDHFQGNNEGGSHNEHLVPQHGLHGNANLQLTNTNIFACCNYSKGETPASQHCGEAKGDLPITDFITNPDCRDFFKYNIIGEILPNGIYNLAVDYRTNYGTLPGWQQDAIDTIETLKLNCEILKTLRRQITITVIRQAQSLSRPQAQGRIQILNHQNPFAPLVELIIFYLQQVH